MVHEIVGRINGHYGTLTHVPIHHLDRCVLHQAQSTLGSLPYSCPFCSLEASCALSFHRNALAMMLLHHTVLLGEKWYHHHPAIA